VTKQRRFALIATLMVGAVGYLMVTGMRESMVYYYTPDELLARTASDRTLHEIGLKVGGRVVPGTVQYDARTLDLRFMVMDIASGAGRFPVHYQGPLPDTFEEGRDVVVEGRYTQAGLFEAATLLTKCGSRYEAVEEDYKA
jgi:cytochrome c-type biogenesis protein CcmE